MTSKALPAVFLFSAGALFGCADFSRGPYPVESDAATDQGVGVDGASADGSAAVVKEDATSITPLSFAEVHPLLLNGCRECHREGGQAANTNLIYNGTISSDLATTLPYLNRNDAANSRLLTKATGRNHGGGTVWAPASTPVATVLNWIQQGTQP